MAKFNASGIDGLLLSFEEFARIPDEVVDEMLVAAGEVVQQAHKDSLRSLGLVDTGKLVSSIKFRKKIGKDNRRKVIVYPAGKHGSYNRKLVTKKYKRSKHGRTYTVGGDVKDVTNNDVGFIHEYGAPKRGIPARQWMKTANEKCAKEMVAAEARIYDAWLKSKNL